MPAVQSSYNQYLSAAILGMVANMEMHDIISREVQTAGGIGFGAVALSGTTDIGCQAVSGATGTPYFVGITILDPTLPAPLTSPETYPAGSTAAIMLKGVVWVTTSVTVTQGQPAYYTSAGVITNVSTSNTAIPNSYFESSGASGTLVKLRLK